MKINTGDVSYGFWLGLGLLLAVLVWHLGSALVRRGRANG